ncbi:hypothetical protein [Chondromyces crocatus]|uniref:Uncharacterized protein n=1 Tax=Chondromyces crocatus TaxID=52 RepID=A0A0K1E8E8_CHOCO|nr:hypothetical protein [Chondromyces crocatus]AKT37124.1 uncharacterized protein CMC5_012540 [Chondromyces crocatus]
MLGASPHLERARWVLLPLLILGAAVFFGNFVHGFYPIQRWLFWRYAAYWVLCAFWSAACVSAGHLTITRVLRRELPIVEQLVTSFAVGLFEFFLAMSLAGALHLYHPALFFTLPLIFIAAGFEPLRRYLTRAYRHLRHARRRAPPAPLWTWGFLLYGLLGAAMVYFLILTPDNIQFDSRWKHLALAEDYVAHGGIRRFAEGYTVATYPHIATFIYTWAFLLPGGLLFDKVELAAHMEFVGFLWTLVAIPATLRLLLPKGLTPRYFLLSFGARFLFPGVFLYDSSVSGGADHIAAIFALPTFTLLVRSWRDLSPRPLSLLLMTMAGGGLTKYTGAIIMVPFPALAVAVRAVHLGYLSVRGKIAPELRRNWYLGPLAAVGFGLLYTSPHWLKNLIWYTDPLYPTLYKHIALTPWTPDAADLYEWGYKDYQFWRPSRDADGVARTLRALVDFSFIPNDYKRYHGMVPLFGSLFTLLLACLPFVRGTARLWGIVGYAHVGLAAWYWTHHQDRYLQAIVPLFAATTATLIVLVWRAFETTGPSRVAALATRVTLAGLIGLQIIWGGDAYFIQTHAMIRSPQKAVIDLLSKGHLRKYDERFDVYPTWQSIGRALPKGARLLLHDNHNHLGIGAESVSDWGGWQFGISYGRLQSPREVHDLMLSLGVTHIAWEKHVSKGWDSIAGDLVFFHYATQNTKNRSEHSRMLLTELGPAPDADASFPNGVAWLGCNDDYKSGLYALSDLTVPAFGPKRLDFPAPRLAHAKTAGAFRTAGAPSASTFGLASAAGFLVVDPRCERALPASVLADFTLVATRRETMGKRPKRDLYIRTSGEPRSVPELPDTDAPDEPTAPDAAATAEPDTAGSAAPPASSARPGGSDDEDDDDTPGASDTP